MKNHRDRRRSGTVVCAALLVLAAVAGGAYAATSGGGAIHACAKKSGGALRLAGHCKHSEKGVTWSVAGAPGARGVAGPPGAQGTARAYASVNVDSTFESPPKGFSSVARPSGSPTGIYCLTPAAGSGIDATRPNAVVSPEWFHSSGTDLLVFALNAGPGSCPTGTIEVHTYTLGADPAHPALSNNVAFTIIVP